MFTVLDASLVRERNSELLREVRAARIGGRTSKDRRRLPVPPMPRGVGALVTRLRRAGGEGTMPMDA